MLIQLVSIEMCKCRHCTWDCISGGSHAQAAIPCAALVHMPRFLRGTFLSHHGFSSGCLKAWLALQLCVGESLQPGFMDLQTCH